MPITCFSPTPCLSARSLERWMVGPSAIGSEKGTPSSMMSAPAPGSACMIGTVIAGLGSPAVTKGISAFFLCAWSFLNVSGMRDMFRQVGGMKDEGGSENPGLPSSAVFRLHPWLLQLKTRAFGDGIHVLVAAAGKIHQQHLPLGQRGRQLQCVRNRVRGLQRRHDAFHPGQRVKGVE